jgi:hypothetical protein
MRRMAVLLLTALAATACVGGNASHAASDKSSPRLLLPPGARVKPVAHTPGVLGHPVKARIKGNVAVVLNNGKIQVCALISGGQVSQIMAMTLPKPQLVSVGTFDECATTQHQAPGSQATPVHVAWAVPPVPDAALTFREHTINLPGADAIRGLGSAAYCSATARPPAARLFVLSGASFLEIFSDSCAHAIALARIAIPRL